MKVLVRTIKLTLIFVCLCLVCSGDIRRPISDQEAGQDTPEVEQVNNAQVEDSTSQAQERAKEDGSTKPLDQLREQLSRPLKEIVESGARLAKAAKNQILHSAAPADGEDSNPVRVEQTASTANSQVEEHGNEEATHSQDNKHPDTERAPKPGENKLQAGEPNQATGPQQNINESLHVNEEKNVTPKNGANAPVSVARASQKPESNKLAGPVSEKIPTPASAPSHSEASAPSEPLGVASSSDRQSSMTSSITELIQKPIDKLVEIGKSIGESVITKTVKPNTEEVTGANKGATATSLDKSNKLVEEPTYFNFKSVEISGVRSVDRAPLDRLASLYTGRDLRFEQVLDLASKIEDAYRKQGLIAKVVITPQGTANASLKLDVIESVVSGKQVEKTLEGISDKQISDINAKPPAQAATNPEKEKTSPPTGSASQALSGISNSVAVAVSKPLESLKELGKVVSKAIQPQEAASSSAAEQGPVSVGAADSLVRVDDELSVNLKRVDFKGVRSFDPALLQPVVAGYLSRDLRFEQLLEMTTRVESYYRSRNLIARVIMPPQDLSDSVLRLDVLESTLSEVRVEEEVKDLPKTQARVLSLIDGQQRKGDVLNTASIERGLGLANDVPGVNVTGGLKEGDNESETELILKLYANKSRQQEIMVDNFGSRSTGFYRVTGLQNWINPNDLGDKFSATEVLTEGSQYVRMAYDWAFGNQGWRTGVNFSHMTYKVVNGLMGVVGATGQADTYGVTAAYPLERSPGHDSTSVLSYDQKYYTNVSPQGFTNSQYRVDAFNANVNGVYRDLEPGGKVFTYDTMLTLGYVNLNGSMNQIMDASGANTEGMYAKFRFIGTLLQPLTSDLSFYGSFRFQQADKNLDGSERMGLGGVDGVRAYPTGEGGGSDAQLLSLELRRNLDELTQVSGFYDAGQTNQQHNANYPGSPTPNSYFLQGVGAAITRSFNNGTQLKATWARRLGDNPNPTQTGTDQDGTLDRNRFWLQVMIPF